MLKLVSRVAFWGAVAFATFMALVPVPPPVPGAPTDKAQHIIAFVVLAVLAANAYPKASLWRIGMALCVLGAAIEIAQLTPILHRDGDVFDWLADMLAVAVALTVVSIVRKRLARTANR